ncbi:MAG TPA: SPOR domain-containing protein, partial [Gammaproteobacteria bacterium]|nr:SPOR domain-containing protein [Gammaproteobacteria bacterium]
GGKAQQDRFYKLVGGVVVGLVAAVALLPLLFGGEEREEPRVVEIEPPLREQPAQTATPEDASPSPEAGRTAGDEGDDSEKWWRSDADGSQAGGEAPSQAAKPSQPKETATSSGSKEAAREPTPESSAQTAGASGDSPDRSPEPDQAQAEASASNQTDSAGASATSTEQATADDAAADAGETDPPKAENGGFWAVMVGSFQERGNAQSLVERLKKQGFSAEVHPAQVNGDTWNRVLVGEAESRKEANALVPRLKEAGYRDMLLMEVE